MAKQLNADQPINSVTINTRHFISTVDVQNRTYTVFGDFAGTEIMMLGDPQPINDLIKELSGLQSMLRRLAGLEGGDDQQKDGT